MKDSYIFISLKIPTKRYILKELVCTLSLKSVDIAISLNYSLNLAGALGALGRRFESYRPDSHIKGSQQ